MSRLVRSLERFWFPRVPARRPALLRILVGVWTLHYVGRRRPMLERVARTDETLFRPVGPVTVLKRPLSPRAFGALLRINQLANLAFIAGWRHRQSGPAFGGSLLCLLSYRNSWSMVYHCDNVLVLHALALGLTPAADDLSIDARRGRRAHPEPHWRYGWPIQLMNAMTALTYFLAGVAKLKGPLGRSWATGEALRSQVAVDCLRKEVLGGEAAPLAARMYGQLALYRLLALGSLALELGAPLALVDRRLARLWAANSFGMHWGIYGVMGIRFRYQLAGLIYAPFFDLERALTRLRLP